MIFELVFQSADSQDPDHTLWVHLNKPQFTPSDWEELLQDIWSKRDEGKNDQDKAQYVYDCLHLLGWKYLKPSGRIYIDSWRDSVS